MSFQLFCFIFFWVHVGLYGILALVWLFIGLGCLIGYLQDVHDCVDLYREVRDSSPCDMHEELMRECMKMFRKRGKK